MAPSLAQQRAIRETLGVYPYRAKNSNVELRKEKVLLQNGEKTKIWRRRDETAPSGWASGYKDLNVEPELYKFREVLERLRDRDLFGGSPPLVWTDGEQDVDTAWKLGQVATCLPNGMGNRNGYKQDIEQLAKLARRHVVIPDQDDTEGERQAHELASLLEAAGAEVTFRRPREGKDLTEHVEAKLGWDDLVTFRLDSGDKQGPSYWLAKAIAAVEDGEPIVTNDGEEYAGRNRIGLYLAGQLWDTVRSSEEELVEVMEEYQRAVEGLGDGDPYTESEMRSTVKQVTSRERRDPAFKGKRAGIVVNGADFGEKVELAVAALDRAKLSIYQRSGVLVEPERDEPVIKPDRMLYLLGKHANFIRATRDGKAVPADPPPLVVKAILHAQEDWPFPVLDRVIHSPVFNADGSLHLEPGYHAASRTLYRPQADLKPVPEPEPDDEILQFARRFLVNELFIDFPFEHDADLAAAVALTVEPFIRALIDGPTPLYGINAYVPGTGKGMLANCALIPALGHPDHIPSYSDVTSDAEMRKKITAAALAARQVFFLDNVSYKLTYSSLASALTKHTHGDRVLGVSRDVNLRLRWTWLATGNHLDYSDEIARRVVPIRLDPKVEHPHLRKRFKHELPKWAVENRHRLIAAVVVLVRRWIAEGRPQASEAVPTFGSFSAYRNVVGGILETAGINGFLRNLSGVEQVTGDRELLAVFLRVAIDKFGEEPFGVAELVNLPVAQELVPGTEIWDRRFRTQLGHWLSKHVKQPAGGYRLVSAGVHSDRGVSLYRIERSG